MLAAIRGTRRIKVPLTFAVLTSVAAFMPLLFIPGGVGETWSALPVIVIAMLMVSLVESLLVLPNHLSICPARNGCRRALPTGSSPGSRIAWTAC